jgi:hypothetical protein
MHGRGDGQCSPDIAEITGEMLFLVFSVTQHESEKLILTVSRLILTEFIGFFQLSGFTAYCHARRISVTLF